ncbi:antibiotic biosynthesis monooxygenase family protein [Marininema halotolerans]|uniref:Heme oxygenase (Staphylobilin-producing) n=1 Tax=Marininema halotolerans TaxID=1155944 RepID=A0A1I6TJD8_9BACL|nr:antibiotic biosynthesis monooxygenase [Marininema halotolerans]SFS89372.1 heme oxygenase (staphylobilin-producing) [Marininema halotolerans]
MYQVNNRIAIQSPEQLHHLIERFQGADLRMQKVPGFISFRLLKTEDESRLIVESVFERKEDFINWTKSEAFAQAHGGKRGDSEGRQPDLETFEVLIG